MAKGSIETLERQIQTISRALWQRDQGGSARVIVGAGYSLNAEPRQPAVREFPLWHDLTLAMAAALPTGADLNQPLHIAQTYEAKYGRQGLRKLIEDQIPDSEYLPGDLHRRLLSLPWVDVFTTNYDTLLERAAEGIRDDPYDCVYSTDDCAGKHRRRLVKLHGTVGRSAPLVVTLNDYLDYGTTHPAFVSLMQQSISESMFLLIGFKGDDPNFESFLGWVRRCFGTIKPRIYWCGLKPSEHTRLLLASKDIIPLDLGLVLEGSEPTQHYAAAFRWLLDRLDLEPAIELAWAPRHSTPLTHGYTPFWELPSHGAVTPEKLRELTSVWHRQRQEYPNWHLLPEEVRERIESTVEIWRRNIVRDSNALAPVERLFLLHEFFWRLELTLQPILTSEANQLVEWLEAVDPFDSRLEMSASLAPRRDEVARAREAWVFLAFCVLRTARDDLDEARFFLWKQRLQLVSGNEPSTRAELNLESALLCLNRLDLPAFRSALNVWSQSAVLPLELAQLAAFHAECGNREAAETFVRRALEVLGAPTTATLWLEGWCHSILNSLTDKFDGSETRESRTMLARAKRRGYDVWATLETFRSTLKKSEPQPVARKSYHPGFESGEVREITYFGRGTDQITAFQLMRLIERAPVGIFEGLFSVVQEPASHAAVWVADNAPHWALSILLRAQTKPEVVDEWFDRLAIATTCQATADQMCVKLLRLISSEVNCPTGDKMGARMVTTALDILSRFALRLPSERLVDLAQRIADWYREPSFVGDHQRVRALGVLLRRTLSALPHEEIPNLIGKFLELPVFGETNYSPIIQPELWTDPFDCFGFGDTPRPNSWRMPLALWERLIALVRSSNPNQRRFAFCRLYYLHFNGWLTSNEDDVLEDAVWSELDQSTGLPLLPGFRTRLVLRMRGAEKRNAAKLLKSSLLSRVPQAWTSDGNSINGNQLTASREWIESLASIFRHSVFAGQHATTLQLEETEALQLAQLVLQWLSSIRPYLETPNAASVFGSHELDSITASIGELFGNSLFFHLPRDHTVTAQAISELSVLQQLGHYSLQRIFPGLMFARPDFVPRADFHTVRALMSDEDSTIRSGSTVMLRWHQANRGGLLPAVPPGVFCHRSG